jgi:hypothetical protein
MADGPFNDSYGNASGETIVAVAETVSLESCSAVAIIVTTGLSGIFSGAVYNPVSEIVPQASRVHPLPTTLQVIWNCVVSVPACRIGTKGSEKPAATLMRDGEIPFRCGDAIPFGAL